MRARLAFRLAIVLTVWLTSNGTALLWAQQAPDMILYNGKIVTLNDQGVNENVGTIAEAVAIRGDSLVTVGANVQVRAMAGPNTKSIDLKGRTVIPGLGATHDHPQDWGPTNHYIVKKVVADDSRLVQRFFNAPADQVVQQFPRVLAEAVQKAKPGQWIRIVLLYGDDYQWRDEINALLGRQINKEMVDLAAPNNPVQVRRGMTGILMNQKAMEAVRAYYGAEWDKFAIKPFGPGARFKDEINMNQTGICGTCYRYPEQDVIIPPDILREIYRLGASWIAGYGITLNASAIYTGGARRAYSALDRQNQLAVRLPWTWFWPQRNDFFLDPYFIQVATGLEGKGSDHFWNIGITATMGQSCSKLPGTSTEVKQREEPCAYANPVNVNALYQYVKEGGRLAGDHVVGDGEVDLILDTIERASKDAGMTMDQIRAKRHAMDHMNMWPRQDQIPRLKNMGMIAGGADRGIYFGRGDQVLRDYGERGAAQMQPRKSLLTAGIRTSLELDEAIDYTNMTYFSTTIHMAITRKDWNGKIFFPQEAVSREAVLKSASQGGAYYAKKEDKLGSLESGKWADLVVLDREYLTIPVDDIKNTRALMTMVGGKIVHLVPSLAREWGMQPTGSQVELGGPASKW